MQSHALGLDSRWQSVWRFHRFTKGCTSAAADHVRAVISQARGSLDGCCGDAVLCEHILERVVDATCTCDGQVQQFVEDLKRAGWGASQPARPASLRDVAALGPFDKTLLFLHDVEGLPLTSCATISHLDEEYLRTHVRCSRLNFLAQLTSMEGRVCQDAECLSMMGSISDFWDGRLDGCRRIHVERHLQTCDPCHAFSSRFGAEIQALRQMRDQL